MREVWGLSGVLEGRGILTPISLQGEPGDSGSPGVQGEPGAKVSDGFEVSLPGLFHPLSPPHFPMTCAMGFASPAPVLEGEGRGPHELASFRHLTSRRAWGRLKASWKQGLHP